MTITFCPLQCSDDRQIVVSANKHSSLPLQMTRMKARLPLSAVDKDGHLISGMIFLSIASTNHLQASNRSIVLLLADDDVVSSPAAPGIFAINAKHYHGTNLHFNVD